MVPEVRAEDCTGTGDWKDIGLLPSNGDAGSNITINLKVDKTRVQPGEEVKLTFEADKDCYLTIMDMGTSGRIIRLWPNQFSGQDNFSQAKSSRSFPAEGDRFRYTISGPGGIERVIAFATERQGRILSEQEFQDMQRSGFKQFKGGAKDLAKNFSKDVEALAVGSKWGTAQINICIGSDPPPTTEPSTSGKVYLLSLGVPTGKLKYCASDARRFADAMTSKMGVKQSDVRLVLGSDATYEGFVSGLQWLASKSQPEDSVVVYFSGHGTSIPDQPPLDEPDGRDECFVLHNMLTKPTDFRTAIRQKIIMVDDDFNRYLKQIPARKKIVVADACHSGTIHKSLEQESGEVVVKYYPFTDPESGNEMLLQGAKAIPTNYGNDNEAILAACLDNQQSYEVGGSIKAGLFTHHLLQAIQAGARDLDSAFRTAKAKTEKDSGRIARESGGKLKGQTPILTDPHGFVRLFTIGR